MTHPSVNPSEKEAEKEEKKAGDISVSQMEDKIRPEQLVRLETLLPAAQHVIQSVEDKLAALSIAATIRWTPEKSAYETDENSTPVFGDEEYEDFLTMSEEIAETAFFQEVAKFFGLPAHVIDAVLIESLKGKFIAPPTPKKAGPTYVSYQPQRQKK